MLLNDTCCSAYLLNTVMERYLRQFPGILAGMYDELGGLAVVWYLLHRARLFCLPDCPCCKVGW